MHRRIPVVKIHREGSPETVADLVTVEEPLEIIVDGKAIATLMRTPHQDQDLAAGFLFSEGIVSAREDLLELREEPNVVHVRLRDGRLLGPDAARSFYMSSSCGVCGRAAIGQLMDRIERVEPARVDAERLFPLLPKFAAAQKEFRRTGGLHAAALFTLDGELEAMAEDVGRHNAVDRLVGRALLEGRLPLCERVLVMSSRASFDIVQKAAGAGIPVVAAMGAASSLAVDLAQQAGIQLYWFLREDSVNTVPSAG